MEKTVIQKIRRTTTVSLLAGLCCLLVPPQPCRAADGRSCPAPPDTAVCLPDGAEAGFASSLPSKHVINTQMVSAGVTYILDTYLSAEKFSGPEVRYLSHTLRDRVGRPLSTEILHQVILSSADTRGGGSTLLTAMYNLQWGLHHLWRLTPRLSLRAGGLADLNIGVMYDTGNSNNPAQARLSLSVDPAVLLRWQILDGRFPVALQYEAALPLVGVAFSPQYGQSYYEIFSRGNYDHNVVLTGPWNALTYHQMATVDFSVGRHTTFRLGYLGDYRQMKVNSLKYHQFTHAFVIGWVRTFNIVPVSR